MRAVHIQTLDDVKGLLYAIGVPKGRRTIRLGFAVACALLIVALEGTAGARPRAAAACAQKEYRLGGPLHLEFQGPFDANTNSRSTIKIDVTSGTGCGTSPLTATWTFAETLEDGVSRIPTNVSAIFSSSNPTVIHVYHSGTGAGGSMNTKLRMTTSAPFLISIEGEKSGDILGPTIGPSSAAVTGGGGGGGGCACGSLSVKPGFVSTRLAKTARGLSVGLVWRLRCTAGTIGICAGVLRFGAPSVVGGPNPRPRLVIGLKSKQVACLAPCGRAISGRFGLPVASNMQLKQLYGRRILFPVVLRCGNAARIFAVRFRVDSQGRIKPG